MKGKVLIGICSGVFMGCCAIIHACNNQIIEAQEREIEDLKLRILVRDVLIETQEDHIKSLEKKNRRMNNK